MDDCFKLVDEATTEDCIIGVVHFHNIEGYRFSPWFERSLNDTRRVIFPRAFTRLPPKPMSGISAGSRRLRSMFMQSKVLQKMISAELPVSTRIFPIVQPCILASMTNASVWGKLSRFTSSSENTMGM